MRKVLHPFYKHPLTQADLTVKVNKEDDINIIDGVLQSDNKDQFSIINGVPDLTWPKSLATIDKETRQTYEKLATEYDKFANIPFETFKTSELELREVITSRLNINEDAVVLEVGAGDGRGSEVIAKKLGPKGMLFTQELSPAFLAKAIERLKPYERQTTIEYSVANAIYLPFNDNVFDAAHHFGGISTFSDVRRCLKELARVVKPGGKIIVGDESMGPWLRETEFGKIMMNSNPLFHFNLPLELIPVEARKVKVEWVMMGAFFLLEFEVGEGEPEANYFVPIPSQRGGNHWVRYYGQLEGVTDETKKLAYEAQKKSGKSMHEWLDEVVSNAARNKLNE
uniref:Class I SAM-dependent methyltransferase n=1 Tax=Roseihalotalea indica TaxID=2867963 RepID=A0AA49GLC2_9BACT|nr:class I SAM-dependent methyltransferase [Tunicatimonas sp. TK19036]